MRIGARMFWIISRTAAFLYRHFPVFGPLRGAVAIVRRGERYVAVLRSDGFGLCFPGGIAWPWESSECTVRREVLEETGLTITTARFCFSFETSLVYPTLTNVFEAEAAGDLKGSWEGAVMLASLDDLERQITPTQTLIVEFLRKGQTP